MRAYILGLPNRLQPVVIVAATIVAAFTVSSVTRILFNIPRLDLDNGLITSVYGTLGTTYAVLIAFVVSGVWQSFSAAGESVKREASALTDLALLIESFSAAHTRGVREAAKAYVEAAITRWELLALAARNQAPAEEINLDTAQALVLSILAIKPEGDREVELYGQALDLMAVWLDARRARLRSAYGNTAGALWGLLLAGALVLFVFHGLFVTHVWTVWAVLLLGLSFILGLAFYLIFSLDSPFTGALSADPTPFRWLLKEFNRSDLLGIGQSR